MVPGNSYHGGIWECMLRNILQVLPHFHFKAHLSQEDCLTQGSFVEEWRITNLKQQ